MNEELLNELSDAMKRRDKATAAISRWQEQKADAEEDIAELSARIADVHVVATEPDAWVATEQQDNGLAPTVWTPEQA